MSSPAQIATARHDRAPRRSLTNRLQRGLQVVHTHAAMFGYVSAIRAGLSKLLSPQYGREKFDQMHGVDTAELGVMDAEIPEDSIAEAIRYEPAHVGVLNHVFRSLPFRPEDYHLVDLGCGKGRTLLVGSDYPFRAITGIELSPLSAHIAEKNIARKAARHAPTCSRIEVRRENAAHFTVPSGDLLVTMYNPFLGRTFEQCIEHLHQAAMAGPARQIWLAYINPWLCEQTLEKSGYFERVRQYRPIPRNWAWSLWRHLGTGIRDQGSGIRD